MNRDSKLQALVGIFSGRPGLLAGVLAELDRVDPDTLYTAQLEAESRGVDFTHAPAVAPALFGTVAPDWGAAFLPELGPDFRLSDELETVEN